MEGQTEQVLLRICPALLADGDWECALRRLAEEASAAVAVDAERIYADAREREETEPTYIGMGLSVPHARVKGLKRACLSVAFSPEGIPWPQEKAHIIALLVVPWEAPEMHLQLLSRLVRWRRSLSAEEAQASAPSADSLVASLQAAF